jgi:hypothetical protein
MMIQKVYWYCPMCNYSTTNQPMGTACNACGHDSCGNKPIERVFTISKEQCETLRAFDAINQMLEQIT